MLWHPSTSSYHAAQVRAIPKLEDANFAGTKRGHECALILTEGDSAKALAMAGLAVLGRDRYGVFPLRGKLLNVRDVSPTAALGSAEVGALVSILGLEVGKSYAGLTPEQRGLRYGRIIVMADQVIFVGLCE
jgi:DNA topoisomerase II